MVIFWIWWVNECGYLVFKSNSFNFVLIFWNVWYWCLWVIVFICVINMIFSMFCCLVLGSGNCSRFCIIDISCLLCFNCCLIFIIKVLLFLDRLFWIELLNVMVSLINLLSVFCNLCVGVCLVMVLNLWCFFFRFLIMCKLL